MNVSRRKLLQLGTLGIIGTNGCVSVNTNPRDEDTTTQSQVSTPTTESTLGQIEEECTNAYISDFDWEGAANSEDMFHGTLINNGDIAGEVTVKVTFYISEEKDEKTGTIQRQIAIGAQETREITIRGNPPTEKSDWAVMSVSEQACRLDIED